MTADPTDLGADTDDSAQTLMRDCGPTPDKGVHNASNALALFEAFSNLGIRFNSGVRLVE